MKMKQTFVLAWLLLPGVVVTQDFQFQRELSSIPVSKGGRQLQIPWNGGLNSLSVAMPDLDGDGDADLVLSGNNEGRLQFYRNEGNGATGEFVFASAAVSDLDIGQGDNRIAFHDLDGDADLDLFVGANAGQLSFYRNYGITRTIGGQPDSLSPMVTVQPSQPIPIIWRQN